jgi:hypothetical protein
MTGRGGSGRRQEWRVGARWQSSAIWLPHPSRPASPHWPALSSAPSPPDRQEARLGTGRGTPGEHEAVHRPLPRPRGFRQVPRGPQVARGLGALGPQGREGGGRGLGRGPPPGGGGRFYEEVVLVSGDGDLRRAVEAAREQGLSVRGAQFQDAIVRELAGAAAEVTLLDGPDRKKLRRERVGAYSG